MSKVLKGILKTFVVGSITGAILVALGIGVILRVEPFPADKFTNISYSKSVYDEDGNLLRAFLNDKESWIMPIDLNDMNPFVAKATISIEDKRFYEHYGIDPLAVARAIKLNALNRSVISGASTLSMQVIRIVEGRKRTFKNKLIEAVHAVCLEMMFPKEEILKLYLNLAPYGGNIYGIKAASYRYYGKHPRDLTLVESALLAGLPQSPTRFRPDKYPEKAKKRRDNVLKSMLANGCITQLQYEKAVSEPVAVYLCHFPFKSPHFTRFIKNRSVNSEVHTTINPDMQNYTESLLKREIDMFKEYGVSNGAVVIIENATGKLKAMVGSADYFDKEASGEINGTLIKRSPGSALKPFVYALSFDKGLYTPSMRARDERFSYGGYTPIDYDDKYRGKVTIREALVDSLNVPAIKVSEEVGRLNFYFLLKRLGLSTITKGPDHYGLSLVLGSCEVKLLELARAYSCLARGGVYKPIVYEENDPVDDEKRIFSRGACFMIADTLSDEDRLKAMGIYRSPNSPKFAFKTGTSYDHRDAWTIAYNPEYTIGVWLGNFSGKPSKVLVGVETAAPIAAEIFDRIYLNRQAPWYTVPDEVDERWVCAVTGEPASEDCPNKIKDYYIKGKSRDRACNIHGSTYAPEEENEIDYRKDTKAPIIVSPSSGCEYFITDLNNMSDKLPLVINSDNPEEKMFWFINGNYYGESLANEKLLWHMVKGAHRITCSDQMGKSSTIEIIVR